MQIDSLLICVAFHYNEKYIPYLKETVSDFLSNYKLNVHIIIDTNSQQGADAVYELFGDDVEVCIHDSLQHPFHLTWKHRVHIRDNIDKYDVFMYVECDLKLPFENFSNFMENWDLVWPHGVPVLFRIEEKNGVYYNSDAEKRIKIPTDEVVSINDKKFVILDPTTKHPLPYHAMWICPQKALKEIIPNDFVKVSKSRETAASFLIWEMKKVGYLEMEKSVVSSKTYVYHLPNNYALSNGILGQIKANDAVRISDEYEYQISARKSLKGHCLCNQLCLVLNALEQAFEVVSLGVGVVLKTNIKCAHYGHKKLDTFPPSGYQKVDHITLCNGHDPLHGKKKHLDINWKYDLRTNISRYKENQYIHWIESVPSSVCVYIDKFITDHEVENEKMSYREILDFDVINQYLSQFGIRMECLPSNLSPNSLFFMPSGSTPRSSLLFRKLISMLRFHSSFYETITEWLGERKVCNVIHLRNEDDAIQHWSTLNRLDPIIFHDKVNDIYKKHIQSHVNKDKLTIILTSKKENNPVIEWMKEEGYTMDFFIHPEKIGREISAIYDMILASYCQDVFIGACNVENMQKLGSTFSYFVHSKLPDDVKKILVDLDNIN